MTVTQRVAAAPQYPPGWLAGQLPVDMLVRFTTIFERLGESLRAGADGVEHVADPTVTSPAVLAYLGRWLGYDLLDDDLNLQRQRGIVAALGRALPLRGTRAGLSTILEAVTGGPVRVQDPGCVLDADGAPPSPGPVEVTVTSTGHLREHELRALVRDEVPAHLGVSIVIDPSLGVEP
jgi:phage tail-like protein